MKHYQKPTETITLKILTMKNAIKILTLLAVVVISFLPMIAMAAGPGFSGGVDDGGGGACAAPIDGGLSMLVVAGVSYGAKLVAANKKKKAVAENA